MKIYNWFTNKKDKVNLSLKSKIEGVLLYGTLKEKVDVINHYYQLSVDIIKQIILNNKIISDKKKHFLEFLYKSLGQ